MSESDVLLGMTLNPPAQTLQRQLRTLPLVALCALSSGQLLDDSWVEIPLWSI